MGRRLGVIMATFGELLDISTRVLMGFKCKVRSFHCRFLLLLIITQSVKYLIFFVKDYMVKGIELEPSYIFTHYALGRWYYEVCLCDFETCFKVNSAFACA